MSLQRGDVVLATLPFVTRPGFKLRPVLVVQNDTNNAQLVIIQNPAENLDDVRHEIVVARMFTIPAAPINRHQHMRVSSNG